MNTLLKNCRFIPELSISSSLEKGELLIENDKISFIGKDGEVEKSVYKDNIHKVIDCKGATVLPGFFELHTHLTLDTSNYSSNLLYDDNTLLLKTYEFAKEYIRQGYTTVRDCGARGNVVALVRDAIDQRIFIGPRIFASGRILTPTETGNESFGEMYLEADGPIEMRKGVREQYKLGNDFTKVMVTGAFLNKLGDPGMLIIHEDEIKECVETAKMKGSYVAAHCHSDKGIRLAIEAGVRSVEHCAFIEEETVKMMMEREDCFLVPTAAIGMEWTSDEVDINDANAIKNKMYEDREKECINRAYRLGLQMGFGSDIDMTAFKRFVGYEFIARKEFYDFENIDILKQATINSAKVLGLENKLGTIDVGKLADLVIVEGNPDEDMNVMRKLPVAVFKEGEQINVI